MDSNTDFYGNPMEINEEEFAWMKGLTEEDFKVSNEIIDEFIKESPVTEHNIKIKVTKPIDENLIGILLANM